jgi:hypothetical protein
MQNTSGLPQGPSLRCEAVWRRQRNDACCGEATFPVRSSAARSPSRSAPCMIRPWGYIGMALARNERMTPSVKRVGLRSPLFARRTIF